ncbi:MAG: von Willebrand factor type A domain-containing protein, partial [Xanthomonadales bacterium]|nr:von Willebrand factor type A domain-containing protein [Xanthomonadales bacterium]
MQRQSSNLSTHPLCFAVALALTTLAGCSTSSVERQQVAGTATGQLKDDSRLDRDESKVELDSIAVGGARRAREEERAANEMPPPAPPAPAYPATVARERAYKQVVTDLPVEQPFSGEKYAEVEENPIVATSVQPTSTFSIDVDT